jgi:predicted tellurium resistance membrane protein TerC
MRLVIGKLLSLIERYPPLVDGAFVIISWVGFKLLVEYLHKAEYIHVEIPNWFSLGLIITIFAASFLYARRQVRATALASEQDGEEAARDLFKD